VGFFIGPEFARIYSKELGLFLVISKGNMRRNLLRCREQLTPEDVKMRSRMMVSHLINWLKARHVNSIFLYSPFRNEPDLTDITILHPEATYAMPLVTGPSAMDFYPVNTETTFTKNRWGILEPDIESRAIICNPDSQTLVLIPAVAADIGGNRLGYGAGFYDRYLVNSKATHMIAVFEEFIIPMIPRESHDIKSHFILSESGVGEC